MSRSKNMLLKVIILSIAGAILVIYFNSDMRKKMQNATKNIISKTDQQEKSLPQPPTQDEILKLIESNMQYFATSLKQKDMLVFYKNISTFWQKKTTIKDLNQVFEPLSKSDIDLTILKNIKPILTSEAKIDDNGELLLVGHYNTSPSVLYFKQTYYLEETGEWKLSGFYITIK